MRSRGAPAQTQLPGTTPRYEFPRGLRRYEDRLMRCALSQLRMLDDSQGHNDLTDQETRGYAVYLRHSVKAFSEHGPDGAGILSSAP